MDCFNPEKIEQYTSCDVWVQFVEDKFDEMIQNFDVDVDKEILLPCFMRQLGWFDGE